LRLEVCQAVVMPCGPYVNDASQNFTLDAATGAVAHQGATDRGFRGLT
jgi:hypothetical protein